MLFGQAIGKERDGKGPQAAPEQLAVAVSVSGELEQELSVMAAVR